VDVVTVSRLDSIQCSECASPLDGFLASHFCPKCQTPQPLREGESYFYALGVPIQFAQDQEIIQKRFYEISRALHPDRFASAPAHHRVQSMSRMSFLNQAYQTLKSPSALRDYILKFSGVRPTLSHLEPTKKNSGSMPMELAEAWFELQELVLEDPISAQAKLIEFEAELSRLKAQSETHLKVLESRFDELSQSFPRDPLHQDCPPDLLTILKQMDHELNGQNYFRSIEKDVERMKRNANSS